MAVSNVKKSMTRFSIDDILDDSKASVKKKEEDASQTLISLDARENYLRNVLDFQIIDKKRLCYTDPPLLEESHTLKERRIYNELALKLDLQHSSMTSYYSDFRASKPDLCSYRDCTLFCRQQQQLSSSVASQNNDFERSYSTANNRHFPPSPTSSYFASQQYKCNGSCSEPPTATMHTRRQSVEDRDLPYYYTARSREFFPSPSSATKRHSYDFESSYSSSYSASPTSTISPTFGHSPSISPDKSPTDTTKMMSDVGKN